MAKYEETILRDNKIVSKFWDHIEVLDTKDKNSCWKWKGATDRQGYGIFWFVPPGKKKRNKNSLWTSFRAARLMYILEHGKPIPPGMLTLHSCDVPHCVNPFHLRLGTAKDNAADRVARGRGNQSPRGESHPRRKLTDKKVRDICVMYFHKGMSLTDLGRKFGVKTSTVGKIVKGGAWKHITKTYIPKTHLHKIAYNKVRNQKIYERFNEGSTFQEIADEFKIGRAYVRQIVARLRKGGC